MLLSHISSHKRGVNERYDSHLSSQNYQRSRLSFLQRPETFSAFLPLQTSLVLVTLCLSPNLHWCQISPLLCFQRHLFGLCQVLRIFQVFPHHFPRIHRSHPLNFWSGSPSFVDFQKCQVLSLPIVWRNSLARESGMSFGNLFRYKP